MARDIDTDNVCARCGLPLQRWDKPCLGMQVPHVPAYSVSPSDRGGHELASFEDCRIPELCDFETCRNRPVTVFISAGPVWFVCAEHTLSDVHLRRGEE